MPDHLHILMEGAQEQADLFRFVRRFKWHTAALYLRGEGSRFWQRNFYEHLLRNHEDVGCVAAYIWMNPVRKRLCEIPGEYPHSGSMTMPWRKIVPGDAWLPPWKNASGR